MRVKQTKSTQIGNNIVIICTTTPIVAINQFEKCVNTLMDSVNGFGQRKNITCLCWEIATGKAKFEKQ